MLISEKSELFLVIADRHFTYWSGAILVQNLQLRYVKGAWVEDKNSSYFGEIKMSILF